MPKNHSNLPVAKHFFNLLAAATKRRSSRK